MPKKVTPPRFCNAALNSERRSSKSEAASSTQAKSRPSTSPKTSCVIYKKEAKADSNYFQEKVKAASFNQNVGSIFPLSPEGGIIRCDHGDQIVEIEFIKEVVFLNGLPVNDAWRDITVNTVNFESMDYPSSKSGEKLIATLVWNGLRPAFVKTEEEIVKLYERNLAKLLFHCADGQPKLDIVPGFSSEISGGDQYRSSSQELLSSSESCQPCSSSSGQDEGFQTNEERSIYNKKKKASSAHPFDIERGLRAGLGKVDGKDSESDNCAPGRSSVATQCDLESAMATVNISGIVVPRSEANYFTVTVTVGPYGAA